MLDLCEQNKQKKGQSEGGYVIAAAGFALFKPTLYSAIFYRHFSYPVSR